MNGVSHPTHLMVMSSIVHDRQNRTRSISADRCARTSTDWQRAMFSVPKSGRERTLDLTAETAAALHKLYWSQQKFRLARPDGPDFVFRKADGVFMHEAPHRPLPPASLDRFFKSRSSPLPRCRCSRSTRFGTPARPRCC